MKIGGLAQEATREHSDGLPGHQQVVAIVLAVVMLAVVLELVRKRKLREEYSLIWTMTALVLILLAWQHELLTLFQRAIGAVEPTSALFFGALVFLMCVALQFSVRLSKLTFRNRTLSQRVALLEQELDELRARKGQAAADGEATHLEHVPQRTGRPRTG
jgi:hypothetical protein